MEAREIIENYLIENEDCGYIVRSFLMWFGEDYIVDWFYNSLFVRDENDIKLALGEEEAEIVIEHYNLHCKD